MMLDALTEIMNICLHSYWLRRQIYSSTRASRSICVINSLNCLNIGGSVPTNEDCHSRLVKASNFDARMCTNKSSHRAVGRSVLGEVGNV